MTAVSTRGPRCGSLVGRRYAEDAGHPLSRRQGRAGRQRDQLFDLVDAGDPVAQARIYDRDGADELCFLDITASAEDRETLYDVVRRTAEECFMPLTVGGGVRTVEDVRRLLLSGADKVSINTAAVADPEFVREAAQKFGSSMHRRGDRRQSRRPRPVGGVHPWRAAADRHRCGRMGAAARRLRRRRNPADIDGPRRHQSGVRHRLDSRVADAVRVPVIASGGVGTLDHLVEGIRDGHATAVLAASIFHFGTWRIGEAKAHLAASGIPVRN